MDAFSYALMYYKFKDTELLDKLEKEKEEKDRLQKEK
jgi:hypothetical protein